MALFSLRASFLIRVEFRFRVNLDFLPIPERHGVRLPVVFHAVREFRAFGANNLPRPGGRIRSPE